MTVVRKVQPLAGPIDAVVRPPGSKSQTIRSLIAATLAAGESVVENPLEADDTFSARSAVSLLGARVGSLGPAWTVEGTGGRLTAPQAPIDVGASGLTARSVIAIAPLAEGAVTVAGRDRLPERPMGGLLDALRSLGVETSSSREGLPITVRARGHLPGGEVRVASGETTQFATGLLLAAPLATETLTVIPVGMEGSQKYLDMTIETMRTFGAEVAVDDGAYRVTPTGYTAARVDTEPDASAAVYPMVAAAISGGRARIEGLGARSQQPDLAVAEVLEAMGCGLEMGPDHTVVDARDVSLSGISVDLSGSPDGALAVAVAAMFASTTSRLGGLRSLRFKESDRLAALAAEITRLGGRVEIDGDELVIHPRPVRPGRVQTYGDHRMAMSFALVGLMVPGIEISDPEVVEKTWPGFWSIIDGLGTTGDP